MKKEDNMKRITENKEKNENKNVCNCDVVHDNVVDTVKSKMPDENMLSDLSDFFKVIGDNTRIKIIWALDESEMCVCDIASVLNMTKSAVSHQLKTLRNAKLVKFRKTGKEVFYSLADNHIKEIFEQGLEHIEE